MDGKNNIPLIGHGPTDLFKESKRERESDARINWRRRGSQSQHGTMDSIQRVNCMGRPGVMAQRIRKIAGVFARQYRLILR